MKEENYDQKMYSAKRAYVLMKRNFSKDAQLAWYFKHLNENLTIIRDKKNKKDDNCEVLSLTPMDNSPRNQTNLILSDETQVTFICQEYSLVFLLHLNPSMTSVEISSPTPGILFDKVFSTLKNVLKSLAKSFSTPGSTQSALITPDINISIVIWTSVVKCHIKQVLLHGFHLTKNNVEIVLNNIEKELILFENNLAATYENNVQSFENVPDTSFENTDTDAMTQTSFGTERGDESLNDDIVPSEKSLILMLRHCLLLLKLMQQNSQLGIVILTDGFIGVPDSSFLDSILQQMRLDHVAISFIQIGHCPASYRDYNNRSFASVANTELMQFISMATRGFYFDSPPKATQTGDPTLNNIQKGLLARDFFAFLINDDETLDGTSDATEDIWLPGDLTFVNLSQASLSLSIQAIVACRLKEGYLLKTVRFTQNDQDETVIEVGMALPWRWDVHIHYHASALWPLVVGSHKKQTQVKVMVEAPSLLMNDVSNLQHYKSNRLVYSKAMLSNFTLFFKKISQTDKLLTHLYQFNYKEPHYNLAAEIKEFTPLLVESFSPSGHPLHHELLVNSKLANSKLTEFIQFWNLKCLLEVSNWSKWSDPHRIDLLLKHDEPFNRHPCTYLNNNYINANCRVSNGDTSINNLTSDYGEEENYPKNNSNNSLNSIGHHNNKSSFKQKSNINTSVSSQASNSLDTSENVNFLFETTSSAKEFYKWLKEMTTFVMVDKLLYVGFIYSKASESCPSSFFIVRVDARLPYIILHIAFIGASTSLQVEKIDKLKSELMKRKVSFKTSPVYIKPLPSSKKFFPKKVMKTSQNHITDLSKAPAGEILVEKGEGMGSSLCCYMCHKPIDRIQITYKQLPRDFMKTDLVVLSERVKGHANVSKLAFNVMFTTSNLLMHRRWIWNLAHNTSGLPQVTDAVMDKVVYNIVHMRLEEGFHFTTSLPGSLKLIAEFKMRLDDGRFSSCVVQFLIFAPRACSQLEKSGENGKGGLQLVTECWVEPQAGVVAEGSVKANGFSNKEYSEIPDVIYALDRECISAFVTMHNLITLCKSSQEFYSDGNQVSASQPNEQLQPHSLQHQNSSRSSLCYSFRTTSPQQIEYNLNNLEHSINQIPFPFDLLTLTSRCQQVELVFSIFANVVQEKVSHSTESRQFSFTEDTLDKDLYHKSHDILCPNTLLFLLLNTLLKNGHDKELKLSHNDCVGLLKSLKKRERDPGVRPLPFLSNDDIYSTRDRMSSESCENQIKDHDFPKPHSVSPSLHHSPLTSSTECRSKRTHISSIGRSTAVDETNFVSEWKCYLKLVTPEPKKSLALVNQSSSRSISFNSKYRHQQKQHSNHSQKNQKKSQQNQLKSEKEEHNLLITLVPSTYKDLLKLLNNEENDSLNTTKINKPPTKSVAFSAELEGIEEHEASNYHTTTPMTAPADLQPSKRCPLLSRSSSSQETATNEHALCHPCDHITPWPSHVLPIYVYNCSTATFCDLMLNLKINQKIPDLYNDFTFEDDVSSSLSKSSDLSQSPKRLSTEGSNRKISDCESTCSKERWRRASAALYKNQDELRKHSNTVSETYLRCFLIAMYESLRNGRQVLRQDVRATVKSICEESIPLQMDITDFIQTSCSFFNSSPKKDTDENNKETEETIDTEEEVNEEKTAYQLLEEHACTNGLHGQIKKRFLQVISQYFKPIVSQPDYLFYCHQYLNDNEVVFDDTDDSSQNTDQRTVIFKRSESSKVSQQFEMEGDERCISSSFQGIQNTWPNNTKPFLHSPKTSETKTCSTSTSTTDTILLRASNITPLFLQLSCSLTLNNEHKFPAFSVETIPTCICEFKDFLKCSLSRTNMPSNTPLDLSKLRVQLELSCLSLTPVEVESVSKRRRRYSRLNSMNSSQQSNQDDNEYASDADDDNEYSSCKLDERDDDEDDDGNDSDDDDEDDDRDGSFGTDKHTMGSSYTENKSTSFAESELYKGRYRSQCIGHLPKSQQRSVLTCEKLMKWVLKDEMISTLRNIHPVTEDILQQVVDHVKCSRNQHDMCRLQTIPLKFVFGSDRSCTYFITEFEKNRVFRMPMVRVGSYYYICRPLQETKKSDTHRERNITLTLQDNNEPLPLTPFTPEIETVTGSMTSHAYNDNASIMSKDSAQFTSSSQYPKLCSQNFVAVSYKGDKYMRTIEYYADDNKRVRPTSGPAGFEGGSNCITPLMGGKESEKDTDKNQESFVKERTCSKSIKRAQSSTTFDKTSRHSFDSRHKNLSGRDTPSSALDTSSITTGGYDADSSEADEEAASTYDQAPIERKPLVPEFWMVLKVTRQNSSDPNTANQVDIYFHSRESNDSESGRRYLKILDQLSKDIDRICHRVNQKFLLDDLYTNLRFHPLLMKEEKDGNNDDTPQDDSSKETRREDSDEEERNCLASTWQFKPGHFECQPVWEINFNIHQRLCTTKKFSGLSILKSYLNEFKVKNRPNVFVLKDTSNVFYTKFSRSNHNSKSLQNLENSFDEQKSMNTLSQISASIDNDKTSRSKKTEPTRHPSTPWTSDHEAPVHTSSFSKHLPQNHQRIDEKIIFTLYGINKPDKKTCNDLLDGMQKRLNEYVLDAINLVISRNSPLYSQDVKFIQKPASQPTKIFHYHFPKTALLHQFAFGYYLRQILQSFFILPKCIEIGFQTYNRFDDADSCFSASSNTMFTSSPPIVPIPPPPPRQQNSSTCNLQQPSSSSSSQSFATVSNSSQQPSKHQSSFSSHQSQSPIPQQDIYLYVRPFQDADKGIACINMAFIDGKGHPLHLLGSPKPTHLSNCEFFDKSSFPHILQVNRYVFDANSKSPGPTSLIEFAIWECGNLDFARLEEMLKQCIQFALHDLVMEYHLLTSPISSLPPNYSKGLNSPLHSAPVSPSFGMSLESSFMDTKTPKLPPSSINTLFFEYMSHSTKPNTVVFNTCLNQSGEESSADAEVIELDEQLSKKLILYEQGLKGYLSKTFECQLPSWVDFCKKTFCTLELPSINRHEYTLKTLPSVDMLLREIPKIIKDIVSDMDLAFFKQNTASEPFYEPFSIKVLQMFREQESFDDNLKSETNNNESKSKLRPSNYIIVGRNINQWRTSIDYKFVLKDTITHQSHSTTTTPLLPNAHLPVHSFSMSSVQSPKFVNFNKKLTCQKFNPFEENHHGEKIFVPRQNFIQIFISHKKVTLFMYNIGQEFASNIEKQISGQVNWHNERAVLLHNIALQKMGLFNHCSSEATQSTGEFEQLIRNVTRPHAISMKMRNKSGGSGGKAGLGLSQNPMVSLQMLSNPYSNIEGLYRNNTPLHPMKKNNNSAFKKDMLKKHGSQAIQMKDDEKLECDRKVRMQKLIQICEHRSSSPVTLDKSDLEFLKKSCRVLHQVMSPLLFSPLWQRESTLCADSSFFLPTHTKTTTNKTTSEGSNAAVPPTVSNSGSSQAEKAVSRNSSESSGRSKKSDVAEGRVKRLHGSNAADNPPPPPLVNSSGISLDQLIKQPAKTHRTRSIQRNNGEVKFVEPEWQKRLCNHMSKEYVNYLTPCSFSRITVKSSSSNSSTETPDSLHNISYLHKSLSGGMLLLEIGFLPSHFYVIIYAFQIPSSILHPPLNPQHRLMFSDELDKIKEMLRFNSFCHDFHLRIIQSFIQNPQSSLLPPKYPVSSFLKEVVYYFPYEPMFSWNYVHEECMMLPCSPNTSTQLFEYMTQHLDNMTAVSMNFHIGFSDNAASSREDALLCMLEPTDKECNEFHCQQALFKNFQLGLFLVLDPPAVQPLNLPPPNQPSIVNQDQNDQMPLKFWVVLTNPFQIHPKNTRHQISSTYHSSDSSRPTVIFEGNANPSRVNFNLFEKSLSEKFQREQMDYLGYSNKHQLPLHTILQPVVSITRNRIEKMVEGMRCCCYRDHLWMRLLVSDEDSRRKRKTGEVEESKDPAMAKLTCAELQKLLELVYKKDLTELDPRLKQLLNLPLDTLNALMKNLFEKYKIDSRFFQKHLSMECVLQYLVILNPKYLDAFFMLKIDNKLKVTEFMLVIKENDAGNVDLPAAVNHHLQCVISTCLYHLWASLFV